MLKKIFATVGIGAAKVDTRLETDLLTPNQPFRAEVVITGGNVAQDISGLEMALMTRVEVETESGEHTKNHALQTWRISSDFTIEPGEEKVIPFADVLHPETPITEVQCKRNRAKVWIQTGLAIDQALDARDRDYLRIAPTPAMQAFLTAMEKCGFHLYESDVEKGYLQAKSFRSHSGCYQELEFRPKLFSNVGINEVEVSFVPSTEQTHIMLEIDRKFSGDRLKTLAISNDDVDAGALVEQISRILHISV